MRNPRILRAGAAGLAAVTLTLGAATLAGCSSDDTSDSTSTTSAATSGGKPTTYTESGGSITTSTGSTFVIEVESNPSTGFVWTLSTSPDPKVVKLLGQKSVGTSSDALGAPGKEQFSFAAVGSGSTTIKLTYARPSDPTSPDNTTNTYTVTVN